MEYFRKACTAFSPLVNAAAAQAATQAVNTVRRQLLDGDLLVSVHLPMRLTKEYRDKQQTQLRTKAAESKLFVQSLRQERLARVKRQRARQEDLLAKLVTTLQVQAKQKPAVEEILDAERQRRLAEMKARREQRRQALQVHLSKGALPAGTWTEKRSAVDLPELNKKKTELAQKRNIFLTSPPEPRNFGQPGASLKPRLLGNKQKNSLDAGQLVPLRGESPLFSPPKGPSTEVVGEAFGTPIGLDPDTLSAIRQRLAALNY